MTIAYISLVIATIVIVFSRFTLTSKFAHSLNSFFGSMALVVSMIVIILEKISGWHILIVFTWAIIIFFLGCESLRKIAEEEKKEIDKKGDLIC